MKDAVERLMCAAYVHVSSVLCKWWPGITILISFFKFVIHDLENITRVGVGATSKSGDHFAK